MEPEDPLHRPTDELERVASENVRTGVPRQNPGSSRIIARGKKETNEVAKHILKNRLGGGKVYMPIDKIPEVNGHGNGRYLNGHSSAEKENADFEVLACNGYALVHLKYGIEWSEQLWEQIEEKCKDQELVHIYGLGLQITRQQHKKCPHLITIDGSEKHDSAAPFMPDVTGKPGDSADVSDLFPNLDHHNEKGRDVQHCSSYQLNETAMQGKLERHRQPNEKLRMRFLFNHLDEDVLTNLAIAGLYRLYPEEARNGWGVFVGKVVEAEDKMDSTYGTSTEVSLAMKGALKAIFGEYQDSMQKQCVEDARPEDVARMIDACIKQFMKYRKKGLENSVFHEDELEGRELQTEEGNGYEVENSGANWIAMKSVHPEARSFVAERARKDGRDVVIIDKGTLQGGTRSVSLFSVNKGRDLPFAKIFEDLNILEYIDPENNQLKDIQSRISWLLKLSPEQRQHFLEDMERKSWWGGGADGGGGPRHIGTHLSLEVIGAVIDFHLRIQKEEKEKEIIKKNIHSIGRGTRNSLGTIPIFGLIGDDSVFPSPLRHFGGGRRQSWVRLHPEPE